MDLVCTGCGKVQQDNYFRCSYCSEPMEIPMVEEGSLPGGRFGEEYLFDYYSDFYPFLQIDNSLSLGEGFTPIIKARNIEKKFAFDFYAKNEGLNPTWSFKDRGTAAGLLHAKAIGAKRTGTVSTGNMAASVAAYGQRAGMDTFVFVGSGIDREKIMPVAVYGAKVFTVEGDYASLYYEALKIGKDNDIYFINSDAPLRVEGSKTIAFEICEQMRFTAPDYVIIPTSSGGNFRGIVKGFKEFYNTGFIDALPTFVAVQAEGCSPIFDAFDKGLPAVQRVVPDTLAHAINNPFPPSGNEVLRQLKTLNGLSVAVSDEEILYAQKLLAAEGMFVQFDSATTLAGAIKLNKKGLIPDDAKVVGIITGSGLKYTKILERHSAELIECSIENIGSIIKNL